MKRNQILKKVFGSTLLRYFISYLGIVVVLFLGFFYIIRSEFADLYYEYLTNQSLERLNNIANQFNDEIISLNSITASIKTNKNIVEARFDNTAYYQYKIQQELNKYEVGRPFVDFIIYLDKKRGVFASSSTHMYIDYINNSFRFVDDASVTYFTLDCHDSSKSQFYSVSNKEKTYLLYIPSSYDMQSVLCLYMIDLEEIQQMCKSVCTEEMPGVGLADSSEQIIAGVNTELISEYMELYNGKMGIYETNLDNLLCVSMKVADIYHIVAVISADKVLNQVDTTFQYGFKMLLLLGAVGLLFIIVAMCFTYLPLRRLCQKIMCRYGNEQNYLKQLEKMFNRITTENQRMAQREEQYRIFIHNYPSQTLGQLSDKLRERDFVDAVNCVNKLFDVFNCISDDKIADYFARCVLIDMLSVVINTMNDAEVKFKECGELFYETLDYCRRGSCLSERSSIQNNIVKLIQFFELYLEQKSDLSQKIKKEIDTHYTKADFSSIQVADQFNISVAYVSYQVNKATGKSFSDYVWELRFKKAKELLLASSYSIEEISTAIGYVNCSSFRRRFKNETGATPSEFREQNIAK